MFSASDRRLKSSPTIDRPLTGALWETSSKWKTRQPSRTGRTYAAKFRSFPEISDSAMRRTRLCVPKPKYSS